MVAESTARARFISQNNEPNEPWFSETSL